MRDFTIFATLANEAWTRRLRWLFQFPNMLRMALVPGLFGIGLLATQGTVWGAQKTLPPTRTSADTTATADGMDRPAAVPALPPPTVALPNSRPAQATLKSAGEPMTTRTFLDRLMMAESGGRANARNPRSTATGPFQFIEATFLEVARRHFSSETAGLTDPQILALRTDHAFARKAAEAFTRDNAAALKAENVAVTFPNLRLAFLLGPSAAIRILQAPPESPVGPILGQAVLIANPFMIGMQAADLTARAARDLALPAPRMAAHRSIVDGDATSLADLASTGLPASPISRGDGSPARTNTMRKTPVLAVHCNRALTSCKRWIALHTRILVAKTGGRRGLASAR